MSHSDDIMPPGSRSCLLLSFLFFSFWLHYTWLLHAKTPSRWEAKDSVQTVSWGPVWWVITDPPPRWKPPDSSYCADRGALFHTPMPTCWHWSCHPVEICQNRHFMNSRSVRLVTNNEVTHTHTHIHYIHSCPHINICWRKPFRALLKNDYV